MEFNIFYRVNESRFAPDYDHFKTFADFAAAVKELTYLNETGFGHGDKYVLMVRIA